VGVKIGNISVLSALDNAEPLLSTFLVLLLGMADPSCSLGVACMLIVDGSLLLN
jgi:uncharacterized membrane protein